MRSSGSSGGSIIVVVIIVFFVVRLFLKSNSSSRSTKRNSDIHDNSKSNISTGIINQEAISSKNINCNRVSNVFPSKVNMPERKFHPSEVFSKKYISYSRLATFEKCPLLFDIVYLRGVKDVSGRAAQLGQLVHKIIALWSESQMNSNILKLSPRDTNQVVSFFDDAVRQLNLTQHFSILDVTPYVTSFAVLNSTNSLLIQRIERQLTRFVNGNKLLAVIDRIDKGDDHHLIIDYKTGNRKYVTRKQLDLYAYALSDTFRGNIMLEYQFLKSVERSTWRFTDRMYKDTEHWLLESVDKISSSTRFPKNVTKLCDYCSVKMYCS